MHVRAGRSNPLPGIGSARHLRGSLLGLKLGDLSLRGVPWTGLIEEKSRSNPFMGGFLCNPYLLRGHFFLDFPGKRIAFIEREPAAAGITPPQEFNTFINPDVLEQ